LSPDLAVSTSDGLVIVVGCSHPGIDKIVETAVAIDPRVHLVAGGFHLVVAKDPEIDSVISSLRDTLKVQYVAPGHCTGEPTFTALKKAFGERYVYAGLGTRLALSGMPRAIAETAEATSRPPNSEELASYRALGACSGHGWPAADGELSCPIRREVLSRSAGSACRRASRCHAAPSVTTRTTCAAPSSTSGTPSTDCSSPSTVTDGAAPTMGTTSIR